MIHDFPTSIITRHLKNTNISLQLCQFCAVQLVFSFEIILSLFFNITIKNKTEFRQTTNKSEETTTKKYIQWLDSQLKLANT